MAPFYFLLFEMTRVVVVIVVLETMIMTRKSRAHCRPTELMSAVLSFDDSIRVCCWPAAGAGTRTHHASSTLLLVAAAQVEMTGVIDHLTSEKQQD